MWKSKTYDKGKESAIIAQGEHKLIARLLSQRNVDVNSVKEFLDADYQGLSHPYCLHDVEKAAKIFCETAKNKGKVAIIGDYDCDGIISSAMLSELCRVFDLDCTVFLPSRLDHGYGLNDKTIQAFEEKIKDIPDLLLITDCGMNSYKEVDQLREMGIKNIVIIDHHTGVEGSIATNADALISWHLSEGYNEMCACGEVFQFIRGIRWMTKRINPIEFLAYAAIGTIADVSPVAGDNRIIVRNGLTDYALNNVLAVGLHALLEQTKIHPTALTQEDISFRIAPKINAVGRMYHPDVVYDLLVERNVDTANQLAEHITTYNDERKIIQKKIENEAISFVESEKFSHGNLVYGKGWHIGVVGIVASRIAESFNRPSLVIGYHNGVWKGSGRSVQNINLKEILDDCSEMFEGYGGHAAAVGVTIKEEYLDQAPQLFNEACKRYLEKHEMQQEQDSFFDAHLKTRAVTPKICEALIERLSPYCSVNNPEPTFKLSGVTVVDVNLIEKETWKLLKFYVEKDGHKIPYAFRTFTPPCGSEIEGRKVDIIFSFPQKTQDPSNRFFAFELSIINITLL